MQKLPSELVPSECGAKKNGELGCPWGVLSLTEAPRGVRLNSPPSCLESDLCGLESEIPFLRVSVRTMIPFLLGGMKSVAWEYSA